MLKLNWRNLMKNKKHQRKNKLPIVMLILLAILVGSVVFYFLMLANKPNNSSTSDPEANINLNPPTQEEIDAGQNIKNANEEKNSNPQIADYSMTITSAKQYGQNVEIRSFISDIIKDGGTCTYTFSNDQTSFTKTSPAFADATHTNCTPLLVPVSEFPSSGTWSLSITYVFEGIIIISEYKTIEVAK